MLVQETDYFLLCMISISVILTDLQGAWDTITSYLLELFLEKFSISEKEETSCGQAHCFFHHPMKGVCI